jgi:hypothetical protein
MARTLRAVARFQWVGCALRRAVMSKAVFLMPVDRVWQGDNSLPGKFKRTA